MLAKPSKSAPAGQIWMVWPVLFGKSNLDFGLWFGNLGCKDCKGCKDLGRKGCKGCKDLGCKDLGLGIWIVKIVKTWVVKIWFLDCKDCKGCKGMGCKDLGFGLWVLKVVEIWALC